MGGKTSKIKITAYLLMAGALSIGLSGCFTGVESTPEIGISDKELKNIKSASEESVLIGLTGQGYADWKKGKEFFITDERVSLLFDARSFPQNYKIAGKIVRYAGISFAEDLEGRIIPVLQFESDGLELKFPLTSSQASDSTLSVRMPLMIDMDVVCAAEKILKGKKLWIRTSTRYDGSGLRYKSRKFVPVIVTDVSEGNAEFPLRVYFKENDSIASLYVNLDDREGATRRFHSLFSLKNPRESYKDIDDEVWDYIERGEVRPGMSKRDCRLSLGNPDDVDQGATQFYMLDLWQYAGGKTLLFEDGLLKEYRK